MEENKEPKVADQTGSKIESQDFETSEKHEGEFGRVIDALHSKQKLASLRTYQGDVAEYVKEKNESVASVVVKEHERKQKRELEPLVHHDKAVTPSNFLANIKMILISLLLLGVGGGIIFFVFQYVKEGSVTKMAEVQTIIPALAKTDLPLTTINALEGELSKISNEGVSALILKTANGLPVESASQIFSTLGIEPSGKLFRTLKSDYMIGALVKSGVKSNFLIISVGDFGQAFSGMLEWEESLSADLPFLLATYASSTSSFVWRDVIIKNKDARALINDKDQSQIAYTFLDKQTVLITDTVSAVAELSSLFASRTLNR